MDNDAANRGPTFSVRPTIGISRDSIWKKIEFICAATAVFFAPLNFIRYPSVYITLGDVFSILCVGILLATRSFPLKPFGACHTTLDDGRRSAHCFHAS
jgi:hypothetical protein